MADLTQIAHKLLSPETAPKIESTPKRIRAQFGGAYILDTIKAKHVWEVRYHPDIYVPIDAFTKAAKLEKLSAVEGTKDAAFHGKLTANTKSTDKVLIFEDKAGPLAGLVRIDMKAVDTWFEELQPILYYPKNPNHRVDVLPTDRKIRIEIDGVTVAQADSGVMSLWETSLRVRWYLPKTAIVDWSTLKATDTHTACPYKGEASYYSITVNGKEYKDIIWWYPFPIIESGAIIGMVCFYNEKVDVFVDGVKESR